MAFSLSCAIRQKYVKASEKWAICSLRFPAFLIIINAAALVGV